MGYFGNRKKRPEASDKAGGASAGGQKAKGGARAERKSPGRIRKLRNSRKGRS